MLSGEYLVLKGASALAIPLRLGQSFYITSQADSLISWDADSPEGRWFSAVFAKETLDIVETSDIVKAQRLQKILSAMQSMGFETLSSSEGVKVYSRLDFSPQWGLGSSSTLIAAMAKWAGIDPYALLKITFGGSGYDVACAYENTPLCYRLVDSNSIVTPMSFAPSFYDKLFFVYYGRKQDSSKEVELFLNKDYDYAGIVAAIDDITTKMCSANDLTSFQELMTAHESIMSRCLNRDSIGKAFCDFDGAVKSLGAWGGDFFLAASSMPESEVRRYFRSRGHDIVFRYDELAMS